MPVLSVGSVYVTDRSTIAGARVAREMQKKESQWPAIDLTVALTAFPALVVLTLLLDYNLAADWTERRESTIIVLVLIGAFVAVALFTMCYVFYRLGVRLWAGPLDAGNLEAGGDLDATAAAAAAARMYVVAMAPPSYEWVMKAVYEEEDAELPKYESVQEKAPGYVLHI